LIHALPYSYGTGFGSLPFSYHSVSLGPAHHINYHLNSPAHLMCFKEYRLSCTGRFSIPCSSMWLLEKSLWSSCRK